MKHLVRILTVSLLIQTGCDKEEKKPTVEPVAAGPKADEPSTSNKPENPAQALAQLAKAGNSLSKAMGQKKLGDVVNWRSLSPFVPDKLGDYEATGELDGSTGGMGKMQVSTVSRRYKAGDARLRLKITDTSLVPMLRAGFAMAVQVNEDSTRGVKKGVTIDGQPGLLEWRKARRRAKLALLVGGRFIVELKLRPAEEAEGLVALAKKLDLKQLAGVKPKK